MTQYPQKLLDSPQDRIADLIREIARQYVALKIQSQIDEEQALLNEHDRKCKRCGKCCLLKWKCGDKILTIGMHCHNYSVVLRKCMIFENRFSGDSVCLTHEQAIEKKAFPDTCVYVKDIPDYRSDIVI